MNEAILLLGGNEGDRRENLKSSIAQIEEKIGRIQKRSSVYESEPWGFEAKNRFLNQVVAVETALTPEALLREIHEIEFFLGRKRSETGYASRTVDIDILFYNDAVVDLPNLQIPHPRLHERAFTLAPLCEILPEKRHPILQKTVTTLRQTCPDRLKVQKVADEA